MSRFPQSEPEIDAILVPSPALGESSTTLLLNVSHEGEGGSDASTLTPKACDEDKDFVTSDITKQTLNYSVMSSQSLNTTSESQENCNVQLKVNLVKGDAVADVDQAASTDVTRSPAFLKLQSELEKAKEELRAKEKKVVSLSKIRDEVETELQDLTASLFVEAHRMVGEANEKRVSTEKSLTEATMKIDGLETEVAALKTLVLTSTPSRPNRHLHPHIDAKENGLSPKKLGFGIGKNKSPSGSISSLSSAIVVGAGGLNGSEMSNDSLPNLDTESTGQHDNFCSLGVDCDNSCGFYEERNVDPVLRSQFLAWKKLPTMVRGESEFLDRIYAEDIDPCLDFPAKNPKLKELVVDSIHSQTICIAPLKADRNEFVKDCPLLNASQLLCKYHVRIASGEPSRDEEAVDDDGTGKEFCISQLARNRITAVCNLLNYLNYIRKGLVKSHVNDVYWEVLRLRKRIVSARLGFSPD